MENYNEVKIPLGWELRTEEISNNVYKVELRDEYGRVVGCTGADLETVLKSCVQYAREVDEQVKQKNNADIGARGKQ